MYIQISEKLHTAAKKAFAAKGRVMSENNENN